MYRRSFCLLSFLVGAFSFGVEMMMAADSRDMREFFLSEVSEIVNDKKWVIVDTRKSDAFNGWKLDGVKRGGHLPNAVDFSAEWLRSERSDKNEILASALEAKGIEPSKQVLLYSAKKEERIRVASFLRQAGFRNLYGFDFSLWANDPSKPLIRYENFHLLVPPIVVKQLLDGQLPETFASDLPTKFVEVSWGNEEASYAKGHIPQCFHVNTDHFEPPPEWMLGTPEVLLRFAEKYGFCAEETVVISGADPTASYRLAVVLRYMGIRDVRVLNGGFAAWKSAGYPVEMKSNTPPKGKAFGVNVPSRPHLIDDIVRTKAGLAVPQEFTLVDTRTWAEFVGQTSGYKYHSKMGRIPGSVYGQAEFRGANSLAPYRNIDNTMRNAGEILRLWHDSGIDTELHLSFMCGSGWRAAEVLTFAQVMGLSNTSLYSDGWIRWSNDPANPVERGL